MLRSCCRYEKIIVIMNVKRTIEHKTAKKIWKRKSSEKLIPLQYTIFLAVKVVNVRLGFVLFFSFSFYFILSFFFFFFILNLDKEV